MGERVVHKKGKGKKSQWAKRKEDKAEGKKKKQGKPKKEMKGTDSEEMISTEMVSDSRKVVDSYSSQTHGQDMLLSGKSGKHKKIWPFDGWFGDGKKKGAKKKDSEVEELKEDETNEEGSEEADESGASDKPDESEESD